MATEDASYISELNAAYPADGDAVGEGGGTTTGTGSTRGHLNMIKYALKTQFSGLTGTTAITSSEAEMNLLDGGYEGTAVVSTGESGGTKFLREDGDATCSWVVPTDTNTTYTAGDGLDLTGTAFSTDLKSAGGLTIDSTELSVDFTSDNSWTGSQRATLLTDNDGSFDMNGAQNFKCTPTGDVELTFTNFANGQSGFVILDNSGGHAITRHGDTIAAANFVSTVSTAGTYIISYISDGTDAFLTNSAIMA